MTPSTPSASKKDDEYLWESFTHAERALLGMTPSTPEKED